MLNNIFFIKIVKQKISFYQVFKNLEKVLYIIAEKCYNQGLRTTIITPDFKSQELVNAILWTYDKVGFLPHGSKLDPMPSQQPIYITTEFENINGSNTLIYVNKTPSLIDSDLLLIDRIILIYDCSQKDLFEEATYQINLIQKLRIKVDYYIQNSLGQWVIDSHKD